MEDKVSDGVCPLNGERVVVPKIQRPRIFGRDELASALVGPVLYKGQNAILQQHKGGRRSRMASGEAYLVLKLGIYFLASLNRLLPLVWDHSGGTRLV